ncbi:hypothetical protein CRM22_002137, partial [Opisthorchis felineus]
MKTNSTTVSTIDKTSRVLEWIQQNTPATHTTASDEKVISPVEKIQRVLTALNATVIQFENPRDGRSDRLTATATSSSVSNRTTASCY